MKKSDEGGPAGLQSPHALNSVCLSLLFQNKSLKNKLLSGHKLCDAYAEEVSLFNEYTLFSAHLLFIPSLGTHQSI